MMMKSTSISERGSLAPSGPTTTMISGISGSGAGSSTSSSSTSDSVVKKRSPILNMMISTSPSSLSSSVAHHHHYAGSGTLSALPTTTTAGAIPTAATLAGSSSSSSSTVWSAGFAGGPASSPTGVVAGSSSTATATTASSSSSSSSSSSASSSSSSSSSASAASLSSGSSTNSGGSTVGVGYTPSSLLGHHTGHVKKKLVGVGKMIDVRVERKLNGELKSILDSEGCIVCFKPNSGTRLDPYLRVKCRLFNCTHVIHNSCLESLGSSLTLNKHHAPTQFEKVCVASNEPLTEKCVGKADRRGRSFRLKMRVCQALNDKASIHISTPSQVTSHFDYSTPPLLGSAAAAAGAAGGPSSMPPTGMLVPGMALYNGGTSDSGAPLSTLLELSGGTTHSSSAHTSLGPATVSGIMGFGGPPGMPGSVHGSSAGAAGQHPTEYVLHNFERNRMFDADMAASSLDDHSVSGVGGSDQNGGSPSDPSCSGVSGGKCDLSDYTLSSMFTQFIPTVKGRFFITLIDNESGKQYTHQSLFDLSGYDWDKSISSAIATCSHSGKCNCDDGGSKLAKHGYVMSWKDAGGSDSRVTIGFKPTMHQSGALGSLSLGQASVMSEDPLSSSIAEEQPSGAAGSSTAGITESGMASDGASDEHTTAKLTATPMLGGPSGIDNRIRLKLIFIRFDFPKDPIVLSPMMSPNLMTTPGMYAAAGSTSAGSVGDLSVGVSPLKGMSAGLHGLQVSLPHGGAPVSSPIQTFPHTLFGGALSPHHLPPPSLSMAGSNSGGTSAAAAAAHAAAAAAAAGLTGAGAGPAGTAAGAVGGGQRVDVRTATLTADPHSTPAVAAAVSAAGVAGGSGAGLLGSAGFHASTGAMSPLSPILSSGFTGFPGGAPTAPGSGFMGPGMTPHFPSATSPALPMPPMTPMSPAFSGLPTPFQTAHPAPGSATTAAVSAMGAPGGISSPLFTGLPTAAATAGGLPYAFTAAHSTSATGQAASAFGGPSSSTAVGGIGAAGTTGSPGGSLWGLTSSPVAGLPLHSPAYYSTPLSPPMAGGLGPPSTATHASSTSFYGSGGASSAGGPGSAFGPGAYGLGMTPSTTTTMLSGLDTAGPYAGSTVGGGIIGPPPPGMVATMGDRNGMLGYGDYLAHSGGLDPFAAGGMYGGGLTPHLDPRVMDESHRHAEMMRVRAMQDLAFQRQRFDHLSLHQHHHQASSLSDLGGHHRGGHMDMSGARTAGGFAKHQRRVASVTERGPSYHRSREHLAPDIRPHGLDGAGGFHRSTSMGRDGGRRTGVGSTGMPGSMRRSLSDGSGLSSSIDKGGGMMKMDPHSDHRITAGGDRIPSKGSSLRNTGADGSSGIGSGSSSSSMMSGAAVEGSAGQTGTTETGVAGEETAGSKHADSASAEGGDGSSQQMTQEVSMIDHIRGRVYFISKTQSGSRFVQEKLTEPLYFDLFLNELKEKVADLMTDNFGHYAMEAMFNHCNDDQKQILVFHLKREMASVACHKQGSFSIQAMMDTLSKPEQISLVIEGLNSDIRKLILNHSGHYVILRFLQRYDFDDSRFIFDSLVDYTVEFASDHYGLRVMKAVVDLLERERRACIHAGMKRTSVVKSGDPSSSSLKSSSSSIDSDVPPTPSASSIIGYASAAAGSRRGSELFSEESPTASSLDLVEQMRSRVYGAIIKSCGILVENQYGNYIIQHLLDIDDCAVSDSIKEQMRGKFVRYSKQKFSSNVVEKCLKQSGIETRTRKQFGLSAGIPSGPAGDPMLIGAAIVTSSVSPRAGKRHGLGPSAAAATAAAVGGGLGPAPRLSRVDWTSIIVRELLTKSGDLIADKYGNYCLQTALDVAAEDTLLLNEFIRCTQDYLDGLRENIKIKWIKLMDSAMLKCKQH